MSEWAIVDRMLGTIAKEFLDNAYLVTRHHLTVILPRCCERHFPLTAGNIDTSSRALN